MRPGAIRRKAIANDYGHLPMAFEPNVGQTNAHARFLARGSGYLALLKPQGLTLVLRSPARRHGVNARTGALRRSASVHAVRAAILSMDLAGGNARARMVSRQELPGKSNYLIGRVPSKWRTNIPTYREVTERDVYPGIDLVYHGTQGELENDFVVAPGSDPRQIRLRIAGTRKLWIDRNGNLVASIAGGNVRFHKPVAYQRAGGKRTAVHAGYVVQGARLVALRVGKYDRARPLVIDPILSYSTYLGGSGIDLATAIAVAPDNTAFVTGSTFSPNFPIVNAYKSKIAGSQDAFVSKLSTDGSKLFYSTYLGGSSNDQGNGIAVDAAGDAYVTGTTTSVDFPVEPALVPFPNCGADGQCGSTWNEKGLIVSNGFVTKLNATGTGLVYSTYIGDYEHVTSQAIAVDTSGIAYITGQIGPDLAVTTKTPPVSCPPPFPIVHGFQTAFGGSTVQASDGCPYDAGGAETNAFVMALSSTGTGILYSSYLGGTVQDVGYGIATDNAGNAYVAGLSYSPDFPLLNAVDATYGGAGDAFFTKVNTTLSGTPSLLYSSYLGGGQLDRANAVTVAGSGMAYVAGGTSSSALNSITPQNTYSGNGDAFVAEMNPSASASASLIFFRYLGGTLADSANGVAVDSSGNIYVTGSTVSQDFPVFDAFQPTYGGGNADAFVTKLDPTGASLLYSSYLGGTNIDIGNGIALDSNGSAYVAGQTCSSDFPLAHPLQAAAGGNCDAFVSKVSTQGGIVFNPAGLVFSAQSLNTTSQPQTVTLTNNDTSPATISSVTIVGNDPGDFSQTNDCGTSVTAGGICTFTVTFTPTVTGTRTAQIEVSDTATNSPQVVTLSGSASTLQLSTSELDFGSQAIGTTSKAQTVTVTNQGTVSVTFGSITASGAFAETDDCTKAPIPAGTNCTISVTFSPTAAGSAIGALMLSDNAPGSPQEVLLTGTGVQQSATTTLQLSPTSLSFGSQTVGTSSQPQTVTVTNTGTAAITFSGIVASGAFSESDDCKQAPLQPGTNCTINVTFSPSASGSAIGAVTLTDNAAGSPQIVSLSGSGSGQSSDFTISAQPPSDTVSAGQVADYTLTLTAIGSFSGTVDLTCSGLPANTTCKASSNPLAVKGTINDTLGIDTTARTLVPPAGHWDPLAPAGAMRIFVFVWVGLLLLTLLLSTVLPGLRVRRTLAVLALALTATLLSAACNGGTKAGVIPGTPAGTYQVNVVATSGSLTHSATVSLQVK